MLIKALIRSKVKEYWLKYGTMAEVTNRLLSEVEYEHVPRILLEAAGELTKCMIDVINEEYLGLKDIYPAGTPKLSLSRILTYYYSINYAEEAGWEEATLVKASDNEKLRRKYNFIRDEIKRLIKYVDKSEQVVLQSVLVILESSYKRSKQ